MKDDFGHFRQPWLAVEGSTTLEMVNTAGVFRLMGIYSYDWVNIFRKSVTYSCMGIIISVNIINTIYFP